VADQPCAGLDQTLVQAGQRPSLNGRWRCKSEQKVREIAVQRLSIRPRR
jgi:hypothetical protein